MEHPTVSLALIYSRHFGLEVSLACHYRRIKKKKKSWEDAVSVGTLPPCINYSDSKILQKIVEVIPGYSLSFQHLKEQVQFQTETKHSGKVLRAAGNVKFSISLSLPPPCLSLFFSLTPFLCLSFLPRNESEAAGFRSRLCTQPGINQAIPPKLMSPQRLIGSRLFRELVIGSCRHKGLYLIGPGPAKGRVRDWDL